MKSRTIPLLLVACVGLLGFVSAASADDRLGDAVPTAATTQAVADALAHIRPHPRLLVTDDQLDAIRRAAGKTSQLSSGTLSTSHDPYLEGLLTDCRARATAALAEPVYPYNTNSSEKTLLETARNVQARVMLLAGMYRLDHDRRFADRAIAEMRSAASFKDWFPEHFLDAAELSAALGIGYDWCYDAMTPDDRAVIRAGLIKNGLDPGIANMQAGKSFSKLHNNWIQVCYGGLSIGALAIEEDEPARTQTILARSVPAMTFIMRLFAPDGGFEEGPGYWNYATKYNTMYLAALQTALGTDFKLSLLPGYSQTGEYCIATRSPIDLCANFGDCHAGSDFAPQMLWMGTVYGRQYEDSEAQLCRSLIAAKSKPPILELLWWQGGQTEARVGAKPPMAQRFDRIAAIFIHTSWTDPKSTYLAFKGGDNHASHAHLDLGTFVADLDGQRWAIDLGPESYIVPDYFGKLRWTYFRTMTVAHNTLTIDGQNQSPDAAAPLVATYCAPLGVGSFGMADLSACYPQSLNHWRRGIKLVDAKTIVIRDEIEPRRPSTLIWHFHTRSSLDVTGRAAHLYKGGATATLRIVSPAGAMFHPVDDSDPPAPNSKNPGVDDLQIVLPQLAERTAITVILSTRDDGASTNSPDVLRPLDSWAGK